ncbi:MAG: FG-GAP-like repeat-containing protein, partial [Candidatus Solibacter sp.]
MRPYYPVFLRLIALISALPALVFGLTPSSVTLTATPNPAMYGQPVIMTASVTTGATGSVTFYDGQTVLGLAAVSAGQAVFTTRMLTTGARSLRAYYAGDLTYDPSTSASIAQTVNSGVSIGLRRPVTYPSASSILSLATGDFNGDGKLDFVAGNYSYTGVTVFLGNGDGTFPAGVIYPTPSYTYSVVVFDFNADGKLDIAAANRTTSNVSVLLGNGDGTFQSAVNYAAIISPWSMAIGDFNRDGKVDLVITSISSANLAILPGNGDGTFRAPSLIPVGASQYAVAVGDLDGDGKADLILGASSNVHVLTGNGDGTFAAAVIYAANYSVYALAVVDLDGDGKPDVAGASTSYGAFVLMGNGNGTLRAATFLPGYYTYSLLVVDGDGDGKPDIFVGHSSGGSATVSFLGGNGDGSFRAPVTYSANRNSSTLASGDFNGDGKVDVISGDANTTGVVVFLGGAVPDLSLAVARTSGFTQGQQSAAYNITVTNSGEVPTSGAIGVVVNLPAGLTATSLSGAGWTCVLANLACARSDSLAVGASFAIAARVNVSAALSGNVTSTFTVSGGGDQNSANNAVSDTTFIRYSTGTTLFASPNPATLSAPVTLTAYVSGSGAGVVSFYDGATWLGATTLSSGQAVLTTRLLPSGGRTLRASYAGDVNYGPSLSATVNLTVNAVQGNSATAPSSIALGTASAFLAAADLNADGRADLIRINNVNSPGISVALANGDGTFQPAVTYAVSSANRVSVADFNGDGKPDLLVANYSGFALLPGNGNGTFGAAVQLAGLTSSNSVYSVIGDYNGDAKPDILGSSGSVVWLILGNGDGTFQPPQGIPTNSVYFNFILAADMNVDGKLDVVLADNNSTPNAYVMLGNGDGTFQSATVIATGATYANSMTLGDFNNDGKPDLAAISWNGIALLLGNGDGTLQTAHNSQLAITPGACSTAGDFNGDGKLDIAYCGYYEGRSAIAFGLGDGTFQYMGYGVSATFSIASGNAGNIVIGDFNGDGRPDFVVAGGSANVYAFFGAQTSGLTVTTTHSPNFIAGSAAWYKFTITNPSFYPTTGIITFTDTVPPGITATAFAAQGWTCITNTLTCTRSDVLGNGQSFPAITMYVTLSAGSIPTLLTNRASVTAGGITNNFTDTLRSVALATASLSATPNPYTLGQAVTLGSGTSPAVTGRVLFSYDGVPIGSGNLTNGATQLFTFMLPAGGRALRATYSGDSQYGPAVSPAVSLIGRASPASGLSVAATYAAGAGPKAIAYADFNRDGKLDLVTANFTANTVSVLLGVGDGSFSAKIDYNAGTGPISLVTGDFNSDGIADIAVANQTSNDVSILAGTGTGAFSAAVSVPTLTGPFALS